MQRHWIKDSFATCDAADGISESQDLEVLRAGCRKEAKLEKPLTKRRSWRPFIQVRGICLKFLLQLSQHTHTAAVLSPHHFPIFPFLLPGSPKHGRSLRNPNSFGSKGVIHVSNKISTMQGIEICKESLSASCTPRGTSALNLHHRLLQNTVFLVLKTTQWAPGLIHVPEHFHLF